MRILIVSSYLPFPLINGGHIRLYNLIKKLSEKHKITLICEMRGYQTEKDVAEVKKLCEELYTVYRESPWTFKKILKTGFSTFPFLIISHLNREMKSKIVDILNDKTFDLIHIETFYVFQNVPKTYIPLVLVEHNIEYLVYKRYADYAKFYLRPLLYFDILKMQYWEEKFWKQATKLVSVSEEDKKIMKNNDVIVIPNGVDIRTFTFRPSEKIFKKKEKRILFIGDFKWIQNRETAEWILDEIWPLIQKAIAVSEIKQSIRLWIVGKNIPDNLKLRPDKSIIFDENAPKETWKIFQQSAILLSPIRVGGGTSYKILESMSCGTPVVTTPLGIEGIVTDKKTICMVADSAVGLAEHVCSLLQSQRLYDTIAEQARVIIEKHYSWDQIARKLEGVYESIAPR